ncbi:FecCD family ABC transporter permease [Galactobacter valiniphilus]|uniref:FecCD family ABC transporter permease n=1 Tax=Galactobacter valiniphilus TaxID=2676122 RepID=UPI001F1A93BB|nr:iron ABC transporter permease [Galactobacter valiniphilus]
MTPPSLASPGATAAVRPVLPGRRAARLLIPLLAIALVALLIVSVAVGTVQVSLLDAARLILGHLVPGMPWMSDGSYTVLQDTAVWQFRLPRALLAAVVGACLALAGALLQVVVRNPLAEPYILGVSAGAGLGAASSIVLGFAAATWVLGTSAFLGALVATIAVYFLSRRRGRITPERLILAGVALGALFSALTSYLTITTEAQNVYGILFFLLGSVSAATLSSVILPAAALLVAVVFTAARTRPLNALLAGDAVAAGLGVDVQRVRTQTLVVAALVTGAAVSVAGGVGFVGLVVPHIARLLVGPDHRRLVPVALLGGAVFLVAADLLSRTVAQPTEVPLGILTAVTGAPFFLWLLRRQGGVK